ncbi:hypothetical protein [Accumulibacter sp.]|nr:hypothetical protein [Accumulibacter sp.]
MAAETHEMARGKAEDTGSQSQFAATVKRTVKAMNKQPGLS